MWTAAGYGLTYPAGGDVVGCELLIGIEKQPQGRIASIKQLILASWVRRLSFWRELA
jgi:hypothetical protein